MKYWVGDEYLGFGPCAASDFAGRRFTIKPDLEGYIKGVTDKGQILSESELVPLRERAGEYLMLRLRTVDGIEKSEYTRSFLLPFEPIEDILVRLQAREYAAFTSGRWHLTPKGFLLANPSLGELPEAQQKSSPLAQKRVRQPAPGKRRRFPGSCRKKQPFRSIGAAGTGDCEETRRLLFGLRPDQRDAEPPFCLPSAAPAKRGV